jgi:hypothetical protein
MKNSQNGRKYLQIISLKKFWCPEYINNSYDSAIKRLITQFF